MSFLFRHRDPGSRHVYRYGPLRITCVDRDVPIGVRVNAHLMYKVVLSWEDKARCATPFDMIARDLGEFWLLDQWSTGRLARLDPFAAQLRFEQHHPATVHQRILPCRPCPQATACPAAR